MTKIPGFYTLDQAAPILGLTRVGAEKAAKRRGWQRFKAGNVNLYRAEDVFRYRDHRQRTALVKSLGWRGRELYRNSDIDITCPVCGGFAVEWPPPPELPDCFLCSKGHAEAII